MARTPTLARQFSTPASFWPNPLPWEGGKARSIPYTSTARAVVGVTPWAGRNTVAATTKKGDESFQQSSNTFLQGHGSLERNGTAAEVLAPAEEGCHFRPATTRRSKATCPAVFSGGIPSMGAGDEGSNRTGGS